MQNTLKDKVALVTGASRGIGQAIATTLQHLGATVIGTSTSKAGADTVTRILSETINQGVPPGAGILLDVTEAESREKAVARVRDTYGCIDILVNNAGITDDDLFLRMKAEAWDRVLLTNLTAVQRLTQLCLKDMLKARWGRIINLSSVVALIGNIGQANYTAAKAGLIALGKSLAQEVARKHITVNTIAPGFIATDMTKTLKEHQVQALLSRIPAQRMGTPEDVAVLVGFLAQPAAAYITGQTIHVNGGLYMN